MCFVVERLNLNVDAKFRNEMSRNSLTNLISVAMLCRESATRGVYPQRHNVVEKITIIMLASTKSSPPSQRDHAILHVIESVAHSRSPEIIRNDTLKYRASTKPGRHG